MKRVAFKYDEDLKFIVDFMVPAQDMMASMQEAEFDDETLDLNRIQGYKITYIDRQPHMSWDEETWNAYQAEQTKETEMEKAQEVFDELAKAYTLASASDADAYKMRYLYDEFDPNGHAYKSGDRFLYEDRFYKVLQDHTSQADWTPDTASSLYVEIPDPSIEWPEWKQPTGAQDAYYKGDKVIFEGAKYICIAPEGVAVVWDPVTYPAYWQEVAADDQ